MRLGVLDVGSNTVHLLVVDAHAGAPPVPAHSYKTELRLAELLDESGRIDGHGADQLVEFVADALAQAEDKGVEEMLAFATSALRDAPNGLDVLGRVRSKTGVDLQVLSGEDEARLTFLAVRRWYGWSSGRLLVLDIGGGSLEVATGSDEHPDAVISLPLGAGRLTREHLTHDPPKADEVKSLRKCVRAAFARDLGLVTRAGPPGRTVGTSKTFRSTRQARRSSGFSGGPVRASRAALRGSGRVAAPPQPGERRRAGPASWGLSGTCSPAHRGSGRRRRRDRSARSRRGRICPWALREGVILRRLDQLE